MAELAHNDEVSGGPWGTTPAPACVFVSGKNCPLPGWEVPPVVV